MKRKLKLYDSVSQKSQSLTDEVITIYNCGPTVYNDIHIGNLRPAITFDLLIRYLKANNQSYVYVHNLTDIDDKIIKQAQLNHVSEALWAEKYAQAYCEIMDKLNLIRPTFMPKVSDHISGIVNYVEALMKTRHAYLYDGNVLFAVNNIEQYGMISKQDVSQLVSEVRDIKSTQKNSEHDFVLWKKTDVGQGWHTNWCAHGRPGWHTECAYFIRHYLGSQISIHGGGMDLKFPHHENENAQNLALNQLPLAKVWMHIGTIQVNGEKMAKSANNFVLVKDLLKQYDANVLRLFFFQTKYQQPLNFSESNIQLVQEQMDSLIKVIDVARTHLCLYQPTMVASTQQIDEHFAQWMDQNLNLPNVLSWLLSLRNQLNSAIKQKDVENIYNHLEQLVFHLKLLGFQIKNKHHQKVQAQIKHWQQLMKLKQFAQADQIRNKLIAKGLW